MKNKILIIITFFIGFWSISCEDFLDVNEDPNNPTYASADLILPVGQMYTARLMQKDRRINHLGNMMMYNWSEAYGFSWYDSEFKYLVTSTFYQRVWNDAYTDALKMYADLENASPEEANFKAIAEIMKAYHFQLLVDLYGDIPYTEALKRGENPTPKYDDAQFIYDDLIVKLTAAIEMIKANADDPTIKEVGEADVMFDGDMDKWIQFANTLKVRILVRESGVKSATYIEEQMAIIEAEGSGYITEDVAVNPGYNASVDQQNPYWDELGTDVGGTLTLSNKATCATQWILDYLIASNDPRKNYMYEPDLDLGVNQGLEVGKEYGEKFVANIGPGHLKGADMDAVIFTLAEHNFNLAEMCLVRPATGDAETYYESGVRASFNYLGVTEEGAADTYLAQADANINYSISTDKLQTIITQKWLATNGITAEQSWFDYTRTGYPINLPVSEMASTDDRPVRLFYPSSEITGNTANVPTQPDAFKDKIFWAN